MNPIIVSTIIASASFIVSIFAASWLNQRHIDKLMEVQNKRIDDLKGYFAERLKALEEKFDARFDALSEKFDARLNAIQEKFDARFDTVNVQLEAIEHRLGELEQRVRRLEDILFKPTLR